MSSSTRRDVLRGGLAAAALGLVHAACSSKSSPSTKATPVVAKKQRILILGGTGVLGPKTIGGTPVTISLYVDDVDATFQKAIDAGATARREPENQFYGDRAGQFEDPFGHRWSIATHVEDVPPHEMERRAAEMAASG